MDNLPMPPRVGCTEKAPEAQPSWTGKTWAVAFPAMGDISGHAKR